jgi:DNA-binding LytR/AlgR family response regulator
MKAIIVDDVVYAISNLKKIISELNTNIKIVAEITNPKEVILKVKDLHPDIIFMDIDFGLQDTTINGLILAEMVSEIYPETIIIYATAHSHFIMDAVNGKSIVLGYITKPFNRQKVGRTLDKINRYVTSEYILIKDKENNLHYINPKTIIMVEKITNSKDAIIYFSDKHINTLESLLVIEEKLKKYNNIIKSHKSFLINYQKIQRLSPYCESSYSITFQNDFTHSALITRTKAKELGLVS